MRSILFALLSLSAAASTASAHTCDPAYPNACVSPLATVHPSAIILPGADVDDFAVVGPNVEVGASVLGSRAVLAGRSNGAMVQPFGDNSVLSRGAAIGVDADVGDDVVIGRSVTTGSGFVAEAMASVGYASVIGNDVTLGSGAVVGNLVTVGDRSTVRGVVGRSAILGEDVDVDAVVGPGVEVGDGAMVGGRIRKDAVIGSLAEVDPGARIGRGASIGLGAILGDDVIIGANAVVPDCAWLPGPEQVGNGQVWAGSLYVSGCVVPSVLPDIYPLSSTQTVRIEESVYDATGNLIVVAVFANDASYDGTLLANPGAGRLASVVVKFDRQMNVLWSTTMTSSGFTELRGLNLVGNDIYLTGSFSGTLTAGSSTVSASSAKSLLVGKLAADTGVTQWLQTSVSPGYGEGRLVVADGQGVTIAGDYRQGASDFGGGVTLPHPGQYNAEAMVVRFDSAGTAQWAKRIDSSIGSNPGALLALPNGNLAVVFNLYGNVGSGSGQFASGLSDCSRSCGVLAIVDPLGAPVASHQFISPTGTVNVEALAYDNGRILASVELDGGLAPFAGQTLSSPANGLAAGHILQYTVTAAPVQAWSAPATTENSTFSSIEVHNGVLYTGVEIYGTATFGAHTITHSNGATDSYSTPGVAAFDLDTGAWLWARSVRAEGPPTGYVVAAESSVSLFDDAGTVEMTVAMTFVNVTDLSIDGVPVPFSGPNAAILVRSGVGPTWVP